MPKKVQLVCRFGFPIPPVDKTVILEGLNDDREDIAEAKNNFKQITSFLNELKSWVKSDLTFEQFLSSLKLSYDKYILAIRSSIKSGQKKCF